MASLDVQTEGGDGSVRLTLAGELEISTAPKLESELEQVEAEAPATVVIDLRKVEFIDSTGLRALVGADARARQEGRRAVIVRGPKAVQRVFDVTRLDERLEIVDDPDAAQA